MAKQEIIEFDNGATLIYQKQSAFDGHSFVIGFRGGSQLDGKYKGLSHLLEHLIFRSPKENLTKNILNNILNNSFGVNAYTSPNDIRLVFSAVDKNADIALNEFMKRLTSTDFSEEQIAKEIDVVKQEINLTLDRAKRTPQDAFSLFLNSISEVPCSGDPLEVLGTPKTLKTITPDVLKKYVERYFNSDNLVISVTSNKPKEAVIKLIQDKIFSRIKPAKDPRFVVDYPAEEYYKPINMLVAIPNQNMSNVNISLLLRERSFFDDAQYFEHKQSTDPNKLYAFDVMEEYLMNTIGGLMWNKLRGEKQLVYTYDLEHINLGTPTFKAFSATTNSKNMRTTIRTICSMVKELGENGIPQEMFEGVKTALIDREASVLQRFKNCSAEGNYEDLMFGGNFLDYSAVSKHISNMSYEEFNASVTKTYKTANVSLLVDGGFDASRVYKLIEVEEMLGNYAHSKDKQELNQPRAEATLLVEPTTVSENTFELDQIEDMPATVTIDDHELV